MMTALFTLLVLGLLGMVFFGVMFALVGVAFSLVFGLAGILLFKVVPLVLLGWIALKLIDRSRSSARIDAADRRWLDGE